ncbi:amino acid ABC transporter ATP-binding protein [Fructobacillus pseudoficulneus]|uniref:Amino acid ABC transporter ATP-binding protein n=1 Tax=Fructobacillus pseudoficulneus TaxID=220714 RepID=A0A3F3HA96_9LACO|nr:amino acid ABC transporter ATP-binding protein [Fructobacillus pseudoficulneus]GAP03063.1 amino acid ABC transporter ATP-binding protein [Fructobacillus pseudoficulneus]SEH41675.1 amino acid ABC transporter ATP-binding protein, PAAT family (TC 3.A.1.3.-) [Fructobacillus pseudoficulneus]
MIKVENLSKKYPDKDALKEINVTFPAEETTAIVGPSGSGKSTLLQSLNLLERPTSGQLIIDDLSLDLGQNLSKSQVLEVRKHFGMVFQEKALFTHLTVLHNLTEGPIKVRKISKDQALKKAEELLAQFGMEELADRYPYQLSGGQQQRVAILRALAMEPQYLLLDEPTSALDPELEAQVLRVLRDLAQKETSMIVVTHNMAFARQVADKIVFIDNGAVGYDGKTEDFFNSTDPRIQQFLGAMTF